MSARIKADVNVFETLATEKAVSLVTGRPAATSASPAVPCQLVPSANTIAALMPGIPYFARSRSRRASSAATSPGVALGGAGLAGGAGVAVGEATDPVGRGVAG